MAWMWHFARSGRWHTIWLVASGWLTQGFAALMLIVPIAALILFWPVPHLGATIDPTRGMVLTVEPASAAGRAGVLAGDRIISLYGYEWQDIDQQLFFFPLAWQTVRSVPLTIERQGVISKLTLAPDPPEIGYQLEKVTAFLLALACWLTGYRFGLLRRAESLGAPLIAWFWMGVAGIIGAYTFATYGSYPLTVALQWLLFTLVAPTAVYLHLWFPPRSIPPTTARSARHWLIASIVALNGLLVVSVTLWQPPLVVLMDVLSTVVPASLALACIGSGLVLWHAYRHTASAHRRRQVRLIAFACFFVACCWCLLRTIPTFLDNTVVIADHWIDLVSGLIPLAYLVGSLVPDLYRLDRLIARFGVHATITLLLVVSIAGTFQLLELHGPLPAIGAAVCFVALYRPLQQLGVRLLPVRLRPAATYEPLDTAATQLTTTLDGAELTTILCSGVQSTFGSPPVACYLADIEGTNDLTLVLCDRLRVPDMLTADPFTEALQHLRLVVDGRTVQQATHGLHLSAATDELRSAGVVLWCPILHIRGHLLGLLLLGMRGDLDPYRANDIRELQRLIQAAALAFTNSATYMEQALAEQTIRQLYQRLQHAQDATAAAIARELHDEVINVNVRLNIEALRRLVDQIDNPRLQAEAALVLDGEQTLGHMLRLICEQLYPAGIDDPLGLPAILRRQVEKAQATWSGTCRLVIEEPAAPIDVPVQHEALRIVREALTNAIKHADATEIEVRLRYPEKPNELACLTIRDNGRGKPPVMAKPGHLGVRNMIESARAAGGSLEFHRAIGSGTAVVFLFPAQVEEAPFTASNWIAA